MEDWAFDSQSLELDLLGQDFLDLLSQPVEHFTFNHSTEEYFSRADDWFEFQDLVCMSPTENTTGFDVPGAATNRTGPEISDLVEDYDSVDVASKPSSTSKDPSRTQSWKAQDIRKFEDCLSEFAIAQASDKTMRRRKRFSHARRKEVDHIRKAGACIRCRLMKTAVSTREDIWTLEQS